MLGITISVILLVQSSTIVFASTETSFYEEHAFYIEYPTEWAVVDNWNVQPREILFKSDFSGKTGISVFYQKSLIEMSNVDDDLLSVLVDNEKATCRAHKNGPCWSFKLLDDKIITVGGKKAVSIKYSVRLNDEDTIIRKLILPDGANNWLISGISIGKGIEWEKDIDKAIQSFQLESTSVTTEPEKVETYSSPLSSTQYDPEIILEKTIDINLILVGDEWSGPEKSSIKNTLPIFYDPIFVVTEEKVGVRYNYRYNFISVSEQDTAKLVDFMISNSFQSPLPGSDLGTNLIWQAYWLAVNHPEWLAYDQDGNFVGFNVDYRIIDALATEEFLYENIVGSNPSLSKANSANLIFLKTDLEDVDYLHNYYLDDIDKSTKIQNSYFGLMGYGGNYNMFYFDLYAVPWIDIDRETFLYVEPPWIESLHDCSSEECFRNLVTFHTKSALSSIVTPSFLYPIDYHQKYLVDIVVYDIPGGTSLTPHELTKFNNEDLLKEELEDLFPFAEWEIQSSVENRETRGLTLDFKDELKGTSNVVFKSDFGEERSMSLLLSSRIQPHLLAWANSRSIDMEIDTQTTWHIPVLVVIGDSTTSDIYLDDFGIIGFAPGRNDDKTIPCCAFGVTNEKSVWNDGVGITDLVLHEVGHVLGLNHPFLSWDEFGDVQQNDYFNWYASPMTYSFPSNGCGTIFYFIYTDPCGNPNLSFTEYERERIADARLVSLLKNTNENLKSLSSQKSSEITQKLNSVKQKYNAGDIFSAKGALHTAIETYSSSKESLDTMPKTVLPSEPQEEISIPDWVRNNADWWSKKQISDKDFATGIEFMIKEGMIIVPTTKSGQASEDAVIPDWVRNNADWWSKGQISDKDFANGLQYLIENGIIGV